MDRVQITLSKGEYSAAKREAGRLGMSLADLVRRSLQTVLPVNDSQLWMRYAGIVESGDPRSSRNFDELTYGRKG